MRDWVVAVRQQCSLPCSPFSPCRTNFEVRQTVVDLKRAQSIVEMDTWSERDNCRGHKACTKEWYRNPWTVSVTRSAHPKTLHTVVIFMVPKTVRVWVPRFVWEKQGRHVQLSLFLAHQTRDQQRCHDHFCGRYMVVVCIRVHSLWEWGYITLLYASKSFDAPL